MSRQYCFAFDLHHLSYCGEIFFIGISRVHPDSRPRTAVLFPCLHKIPGKKNFFPFADKFITHASRRMPWCMKTDQFTGITQRNFFPILKPLHFLTDWKFFPVCKSYGMVISIFYTGSIRFSGPDTRPVFFKPKGIAILVNLRMCQKHI